MQLVNRKTVTRVSALILVLMLILSSTACFAAASFKKTGAGVKYNGKTIKLGATTSAKALKKVFGSYKREVDDGCVFGYRTYMYTFKSKGIQIETFQKKKNSKEQIITISISKNKVPTIAGLKVGKSNSQIKKKYGTKGNVNKKKTIAEYKSGSYYLRVYSNSKKKITRIVFYIDL